MAVISCFLNESIRAVIAGKSFVSISVVAAGPVNKIIIDDLFLWYGMEWNGMLWYGMIWHGMICCGMLC